MGNIDNVIELAKVYGTAQTAHQCAEELLTLSPYAALRQLSRYKTILSRDEYQNIINRLNMLSRADAGDQGELSAFLAYHADTDWAIRSLCA